VAGVAKPAKAKTVCFDIDGVLCTQTTGDYENAKPRQEMIDLANRLYDEGYRVIVHTARYMGRCENDAAKAKEMGEASTRTQLESWGLRFHDLYLGKPSFDVMIDDRAVFFDPNVERIYAAVKAAT
jgi:histidinol phosphatase-like enzyme